MNKFCWSLLFIVLSVLVSPFILFQYKPQDFKALQTTGQFSNFDGRLTCRPQYWHQPKTEQELVKIIKDANIKGERVKIVGAGHSWTPIHLTDGHLINLDDYSNVLQVNKEGKRIKLEAGMRLKNLVDYLETQDLALANVGHITEQSVAGAVSTSTHGHGVTKGALSTQVVEFDLILANGTIIRGITAASNPNLFYAGRVGLGLLGVISTLTLQCVDAFNLQKIELQATLDHVLQNINTFLKYEWFKFWWVHQTPYVKLTIYNRTQFPRNHTEIARFIQHKVEIPVLTSVLLIESTYPESTHFLHNLLSPLLTAPDNFIDRSDLALIGAFPPGYTEMEFNLPIEKFVEAHRAYEKLLEENNCTVNFINENRFVRSDENWMSPFYRRDSGVISFIMYKREEEFMRCGKLVNDLFMTKFDGRPHWAKVNFFRKMDFMKAYPKMNEFGILRRNLDPKGIFLNDYFDKIFDF